MKTSSARIQFGDLFWIFNIWLIRENRNQKDQFANFCFLVEFFTKKKKKVRCRKLKTLFCCLLKIRVRIVSGAAACGSRNTILLTLMEYQEKSSNSFERLWAWEENRNEIFFHPRCLPNASIHLTTMKLHSEFFCILNEFFVASAAVLLFEGKFTQSVNRQRAELNVERGKNHSMFHSAYRSFIQNFIYFCWFDALTRYALPNIRLDGWKKRNYFSPQKVSFAIARSTEWEMNERAKKKKWKNKRRTRMNSWKFWNRS